METTNDKSNATDLIESVVATEDKDYPELALVDSVDTKWWVSFLHCEHLKYSCCGMVYSIYSMWYNVSLHLGYYLNIFFSRYLAMKFLINNNVLRWYGRLQTE